MPEIPFEKNNNREAGDGTGAVSRNRSDFRCVYQKIYSVIPGASPLRLPVRDVLAFNLSITLKMPETATQPLLLGCSHRWRATHFRYANDLWPLMAFNFLLSDPLSEHRRIWTRRMIPELRRVRREYDF